MAQVPGVDRTAFAQSEAEDRLRVLLDNMPGALVYTDEALNFVSYNFV